MSRLSALVLIAAGLLPLLGQAQPAAPAGAHRGMRHRPLGSIAGRVVLADDRPADQVAVLVAVQVKGTGRGTTPAADGSFRVAAPAGRQLLTVTSLGYAPQEVPLEVIAGQLVILPTITLMPGSQQLGEVAVTGRPPLQRPTSVGKLPVAPLDMPQASLTVERAVLEQQQVLRLSDALQNTPGLYVMGTTGGAQEELASRGFAYTSANTFKNGVRFNNAILPEASALERLEVLKGSAAILYGNVAAGGVLNLVTKKPLFERGGSVGLRGGSFGLVKPSFDVYGPLGAGQLAAFRVNGTYEQAGSYRDEVSSRRSYVNPSLTLKISPKTELLLEGDYLNDRRTPDFGIGAINYVIQDSRSRFLNPPDARTATEQTSATATLRARLAEQWTLRTIAGFQRYANELRSATRPSGINAGVMAEQGQQGTAGYAPAHARPRLFGDWGRGLQRTATTESYYLAELDLTGTFRTGRLSHVLLLGADADRYDTNLLAYRTQLYDSINILNLNRVLGQPTGRVSGYDGLSRATRTLGHPHRAGFYAQDLINLLPSLKLLAGLRWSYQATPSDVYSYSVPDAQGTVTATVAENQRADQAWSPRLGLVYQPWKTTAVFASYANSFAPNAGLDGSGAPLPPSLIDQVEVGLKNDLLGGALSANLTGYRLVNGNQAQTVLANAPGFNPNFPAAQELAGAVTSQGLEADLQARPGRGWLVLAGYSYNQTAYSRSNLYPTGSRLRYTPAHTANLSASYNFGLAGGAGPGRGLTLGAGAYYVGDRLAGRNPRRFDARGQPLTDTFQFIALPDYLLFDLNAAYTYERVTGRIKLGNLLNALSYNVHDDNSVNPIAPRNFSAALSYRL